MELTAPFVEREYNNRERVPDHAKFFARWERDSQFVRATLPGKLDLAYGDDPRQRIDLFPARGDRGLLVFIHGGYWRTLDKRLFSGLAPAWVAAGISVALPNYRLCPAVRVGDIVDDLVEATNWIFTHAEDHGVATRRVVLSGHSAGGHLTAALFATSPSRFTFDAGRIAGGVPISGIFDFAPLPLFSGNTDLRLDDAQVAALSLHDRTPTLSAPLVIGVGGAESSEFVRQSRLLAERWPSNLRSLLILPDLHHFSVVDAFAERSNPLYEGALALF